MTKIGFGGSCHWCTEAIFLSLKGVQAVAQGWIAAGDAADHFSEAVIVEFDPEIISLETLTAIHLHTHSCTSNHPLRSRYRSAVYTLSEEQEGQTRETLATLQRSFVAPIITEVLPFHRFRENEDRYLNYYYRAPDKPFCQTYIDPKLKILLERFGKEVDKQKLNQVSYNRVSPEWAKIRNDQPVSQLVMNFADRINPGGHILDIGCGTGSPNASYLSQCGFRVTGIDAATEMIDIAQSRQTPNTKFMVADFFDFTPTERFDAVLAWDSFFHFPKQDQKLIYQRLTGFLNQGGLLLFTHGNTDDEHVDIMFGESFYYSSLSKPVLMDCLIENGFDIINAYDDYIEGDNDRALIVLAKRS